MVRCTARAISLPIFILGQMVLEESRVASGIEGERHREGDLPAHIYMGPSGSRTEEWYKEDERHREGDLPAYIHIRSDGSRTEVWYKDGKYSSAREFSSKN